MEGFSVFRFRGTLLAADQIDRITPIPVLVIHGTEDDKVLYYHAQEIYKKAGEPKCGRFQTDI